MKTITVLGLALVAGLISTSASAGKSVTVGGCADGHFLVSLETAQSVGIQNPVDANGDGYGCIFALADASITEDFPCAVNQVDNNKGKVDSRTALSKKEADALITCADEL